jgi:hypothetical protein
MEIKDVLKPEKRARASLAIIAIGVAIGGDSGDEFLHVLDAVIASDFFYTEARQRDEDVVLAASTDADSGGVGRATLGSRGFTRLEEMNFMPFLAEGLDHSERELAADLVGGFEEQGEPFHD